MRGAMKSEEGSPNSGDMQESREDEVFYYPPPGGVEDERSESLGTRLMDVTLGAGRRLWSSSYTVLTVDLKRASISYLNPRKKRLSVGPTSAFVSPSPPPPELDQQSELLGHRVEASGAQARLKVMQVWELGSHQDKEEWQFNLGMGGEVEMERGLLNPKLRIRAKNVSLHVLPRPMIELRRKWPLLPSYTRLGIDVRCRIPLAAPDQMWDKMWDAKGARLMINIFNLTGPGIHFTPGGLLLEENVIELGKHTKLRVAAALEFPRELPWSENERPFKLEIRRVGIKARTM